MTIRAPINPIYGAGQTIAATNTATTVTLTACSKAIMLTNAGPGLAYVRISPNLLAATAADAVIPPTNIPVVYTKFADTLQISIISASTSSVHVMPCESGV
jgi:hypothetical protein